MREVLQLLRDVKYLWKRKQRLLGRVAGYYVLALSEILSERLNSRFQLFYDL